jgi:hypothetical protein
MPQPGFATYAATKAFLVSFSRAVNEELRPHNIASTTVCPGPVSTDFLAHATGKATASFSGIKSLFVARPDKLAVSSIRAARNGRAVLVYGLSQKVFHVLAKILPARFLMFLASRMAESKPDAPVMAEPAPPASAPGKDAPISMTLLLPVPNGDDDAKAAPPIGVSERPSTTPILSTSAEAMAILRAYPGRYST